MRYTVQHRYSAYRDGRLFGPWEEGAEVELVDADAEWVNRDSEGTLVEVAPLEPEPEVPASKVPAVKAPARGGKATS